MRSLGTRIAFIVSGVLLALMLVVVLWVDGQLTRAIRAEEMRQAQVHGHTLLATLKTLMLNGNGTLAREWIDRLKGTAGIREIMVLAKDGREAFLDTETVEAVNRYLGEKRFSRAPIKPEKVVDFFPDPVFRKALKGETAYVFRGDEELELFLPIPTDAECLACHGYDTSSLRGVLRLSLGTEEADRRIGAMRNRLWGLAALLVVLLGVSLWLALRLSVVAPIVALRDLITRVGRGDRQARLETRRRDELGEVARVFNEMQEALQRSEARTRAVMDNVVDGIISIDETGRIELVNPAAARIFGYAVEELRGRKVNMLMPEPFASEHDEYIARYLATGRPKVIGKTREVTARRKDGETFPMDIAVSEMRVGEERRFIGVFRDVTERKAQTAALRYQALHDALTGLPNRSLLYDRMEQAIRVSHRSGGEFALMIMDLDRFKEINDTLGHQVGDQILQQVAARTREALRESDTVARLGGDEFSVLLPGTNEHQALVTAHKILDALRPPMTVDGHVLEVGASLGIALYPRHGGDTVTLMRRADVAMYVAKRRGMGCAVYDPEEDTHSVKSLKLMSELRAAMDEDALLLYAQPKVALPAERVQGIEALLRWPHPEHGLMPPDEFIPQAEQVGLIGPLTLWVIRRALADCADLMERGLEITMAVNLSVRNLQDGRFPEQVRALLREAGVKEPRLKLEITETAIMSDPVKALESLRALHDMGIKLAVDDFGTGYSSLAYLRQLPVDEIKIDKSFVTPMGHDENSAVIVRSTIDLAHNLGLKVVAEGVEDARTLEMLKEMGCDAAQGYFIAKPAPVAEVRRFVEAHLDGS